MTTTSPSPSTSPSGELPAPVRPRLRRSATDKMLGGVCGGLAEYSGIDVLLWRVGFVGLTVAGGAGVLVYLLLWVLMPPAEAGPKDRLSHLDRVVGDLHTRFTGNRTAA